MTDMQQETTKPDERIDRRGSIQTVVMRPARHKTANTINREQVAAGTF